MASKRQRVVIGGGSEGASGSGAGGRRNPLSSSSSDSGGGNGGPQFLSNEAREAYNDLLGRPVARERGLLPTASDGYMLENIEERGWEQFCETPEPVPMTVVREFYANASVDRNGISQVRGFRVDYRPRAIRRVLGLPTPRRNQEDWSGRTRDAVDLQDIIQRLCVPGTQWTLRRGTTEPTSFLSTALNQYARTWHLFICANLIPTRHSNEVTVERAILLFAICSRELVDVGNLIHQGILRFMQGSTTAAIPYGSVIARLARDGGAMWSEAEVVQQPQSALDHQSIMRLNVWDGGEPDWWGLGYVVEGQQQQQ
ncbi:hypothetical protein POM88_025151 [Heracleum sosnowskyi]|uniref:Putative plant transposon protein domain-containing protein n=1 Tax=Heracleum sosnowskyi TaxID=360622 RepID=A0AAD8MMP0_9APIA|nr:hypothetical protein POM88_025151 [Heracleum sosnowskyi]